MTDETLRILLVEDNPGDVVLLESALQHVPSPEYQLSRVAQLADMAPCLRSGQFDVILLDLDLPDSRGMDTVRGALAQAPRMPIVVLTGRNDENTGVDAVRLGAQDYVVKGELDRLALVRSMRHAIERKQAQQALQKAHDELEQKVLERTAELASTVEVLQDEVQQRVAAQESLQQSNRALRMLTEANEAMIRIHDEQELIQAICQIIVDRGGYRMAWVGFAEQDAQRTIRPVAAVGFEDGYLQNIRVTWADEPLGRGPTGTAVRTGQPAVGKDFLSDPILAPWKPQAIARGFRSSIGLPLSAGENTFGALTVYSAQPNDFSGETREILAQLVNDLSYGVVGLRSLVERRRLEKEVLQATEREQSRIGRDLHDSIQSSLAGIMMMLGAIEKRSLRYTSELAADIHQAVDAAQQTLEQTRELSHGLCPTDLYGKGLTRSLDQLCSSMGSLFRINCHFHSDVTLLIDDVETATQLYYIAQEAISNAIKHSKGNSIKVSLARQEGQAVLAVTDDGVGVETAAMSGTGLGMRTMNYRARLIGGRLNVSRADPHGTIVSCLVELQH